MTPARPAFLPKGFGTLGERFAEIEVPPEVPYTLSAPGMRVVLLLLFALACLALALGIRELRKERYRRAARRSLRELRATYRAGGDRAPQALLAVPGLLKTCALAAFPRQRVASLAGDRWLAFLDATSKGGPLFAGGAGQALLRVVQRGPEGLAPADVEGLFDACDAWIRRHRVVA